MEKWRSRWQLEVQDTSPEGLLNALLAKDVAVYAPQRLDDVTLRLAVPYGDMRSVRQLLAQRGSDLRMCRPMGIRPVAKRLCRRQVLTVCAAVWVMVLCLSNLFVWRIEVIGAETVPTGTILRVLSDVGAGIGDYWPRFDSEALRNRLLMEVPQLQWAGINYRSGAVEVVVRERRVPPAVIDNDEPVHLIATRTGVVAELQVKQGQRHTAVGAAVTEGEVLVSGVAQSALGEVRPVHALGRVLAYTQHTITARQPAVQTEKRYTDREIRKISLILGKKRINFFSGSSISDHTCDKMTMDYHLRMENVFALPIRLVVERYADWTPHDRALPAEVQEENAHKALMVWLEHQLDGVGTALAVEYAAAVRADGMTVTLRAECLEDIGREVPVEAAELQQMTTIGEKAAND